MTDAIDDAHSAVAERGLDLVGLIQDIANGERAWRILFVWLIGIDVGADGRVGVLNADLSFLTSGGQAA